MTRTSNHSFIEAWNPLKHKRDKSGKFSTVKESGKRFVKTSGSIAAGALIGGATGAYAGHVVGKGVVRPLAKLASTPASGLTGKPDIKQVRKILDDNGLKKVKIFVGGDSDYIEFDFLVGRRGKKERLFPIPRAIHLSKDTTKAAAFHEVGHALDLVKRLQKSRPARLSKAQVKQVLEKGEAITFSHLTREFTASRIAVKEMKKTGTGRLRGTIALSPAFLSHATSRDRPAKLGALVGAGLGATGALQKSRKKHS